MNANRIQHMICATNAVEVVHRGNTCITYIEKKYLNDLSIFLKKLEKEEQMKPKLIRKVK